MQIWSIISGFKFELGKFEQSKNVRILGKLSESEAREELCVSKRNICFWKGVTSQVFRSLCCVGCAGLGDIYNYTHLGIVFGGLFLSMTCLNTNTFFPFSFFLFLTKFYIHVGKWNLVFRNCPFIFQAPGQCNSHTNL